MPETILDLHGVSFCYPSYPGLKSVPVLNGLELSLAEGELGLVLGRPEEGKTTLAKLIVGLLPRFGGGRLEGDIRLQGRSILPDKPFELLERVGLVFQNPDEQLFTTRCDTEVAFALESLGLPGGAIRKRTQEALGEMGLAALRDEAPGSLSGGEKKKLLLACLAALDPPLWLLDETLEELDAQAKVSILNYLKKKGTTGLIFSAKWHELFRTEVSRIFMLRGGRIEEIVAQPGSARFRDLLLRQGLLLARRPGGGGSTPGGPDTPLLEAVDLSFHYPEQERFSLSVERLAFHAGELTALTGENGSGKSTLARLLCGLLVPESGRVSIFKQGRRFQAGAEDLQRFTGYMFQNPDYQLFLPTVREELAYGLKLQRRGPVEIGRLVAEAIALFKLPAPEAPPALLGYGARKRLQAAVCYHLARSLLILDEGDSGLSVEDFASLLELFASPTRAILIITHDLTLAEAFAHKILTLEGGRIAAVRPGKGRG